MTYANCVHIMYNCIINEMADAGVTERLDEPVWMDFATIYFYRTVRYQYGTLVRSQQKRIIPASIVVFAPYCEEGK